MNLECFKNIDLNPTYGGFGNNLLIDFYSPLLSNAVNYQRSTAFFTGGLFSIVATSMKDFILENNGKIELVTSVIFNKEYLENLNQEANQDELIKALDNLVKYSNGKTVIEIIGALIANEKLEIKIAEVPIPGIHHEKVGIFTDNDGCSLSFSGSINETWSGWTVNSEEFKVFKSWDESNKYFISDKNQFNDLWQDNKTNVNVHSLNKAIEEKIISHADDTSIENLEKNIDLIRGWRDLKFIQGIETEEDIDFIYPDENKKRVLMNHQKSVLDDWKKNEFFGIIKHATGSGKTFTGINGLIEWYKNKDIAIILVPSVLLLEQWIEEIELEIPDLDIIKAGGGENKDNWSQNLRFITSERNTTKTIIVATIGTALTDDFYKSIMWGDHLLLMVDEVHNIGSNKARTLLKNKVGGALGLSATPERYGDTEGTEEILKFFKQILKPEFSLRDAIDCGRLVPYIHKPFEVSLTSKEEEDYKELSDKVATLFRMLEDDVNNLDLKKQLEILLFNRAKIIKSASNKVIHAVEIIQNDYKNDEHWLVYCQDISHLNEVRNLLDEKGIKSLEYTSSMKSDRKGTLDYFKENGGLLVAIKCLDEGVDIPYLKSAIILSSSQNPREHIQRRGRVLRKSEDKNLATIYDALVVTTNDLHSTQDQIMNTEIKRAYNFSRDAYNPEASLEILNIANKYNIDIEKIMQDIEIFNTMKEEE